MYKKDDLVVFKSEFIYQVYLIQGQDGEYYRTSYFQQSNDGFKLRIHKSHVVEKFVLDSNKFQILEDQDRWKEWIIEWVMRESDYPGYLEFRDKT